MVELKPSQPDTDTRNSQASLTLKDFGGKPSRSAMTLIVGTLALSLLGAAVPKLIAVVSPRSSVAAYKPILDDDGDDMSYHWQNPKFAAEEGLQMGAIALMAGTAVGVASIRRTRSKA